jgi:hypothetical protein
MKAIEQLRQKLTAIGATLDDSGGYALHCDAPRGYVWSANGNAGLTIHYATNQQSWLAQAIRDEMPALRMGLRLADEAEREQVEWSNDDGPWIASDDAPASIPWPGGGGGEIAHRIGSGAGSQNVQHQRAPKEDVQNG